MGAAANPSTELSPAVARYETLRMAMLGETLPPEARGGLFLFLRRGMWGWARTLASASAGAEPKPGRYSSPAEPRCSSGIGEHDERSAVIHVFAAIAMKIGDWRTS